MRTARALFVAAVVCWAVGLPETASAQWLRYPTANVPKTADGKPNLTARAPKTPDGKPDFSGIWLTDHTNCKSQNQDTLVCETGELPMGKEGLDIGNTLPGGLPYQPWLAALSKERSANHAEDDPHLRCYPDTFVRAYNMPHMVKFVQTPALLVELDEMNANYRQVFMDGRPLPDDPTPSWQGYSTAKWEGDTLVVNSNGFRDDLWLDWKGSVLTSAAKVQERIRRPDYGHLEVRVTVDDPKAYTKPWTVILHERIALNTELVDEICLENEHSAGHIAAAKAKQQP
ncbi:MAG TPA: hypothetical protein VG871_07835 [Vicinamibacterales bacterium]|nr:hypothetical protein [Vicinamibacterales bacterium]